MTSYINIIENTLKNAYINLAINIETEKDFINICSQIRSLLFSKINRMTQTYFNKHPNDIKPMLENIYNFVLPTNATEQYCKDLFHQYESKYKQDLKKIFSNEFLSYLLQTFDCMTVISEIENKCQEYYLPIKFNFKDQPNDFFYYRMDTSKRPYDEKKIKQISIDLDKAIQEMKETIRPDDIRNIVYSLSDRLNPYIRMSLYDGKMTATELLNQTHSDCSSIALKCLRMLEYEESLLKYRSDYDNEMGLGISNTFTCGKCKENKTRYTQVQTRSADEPMTIFITCVNCGNRWKQ